MALYFVAHSRSQEYPQTFVPAGMKLTCFADFGLTSGVAASLMSMTLMTVVGMNSVKTSLVGPKEIENRALTPLTKKEFARIKGAASSGTLIQTLGGEWVPGDRISLCEGKDGLCSDGVHRCDGLLSRLMEYDSEVYLICCRGSAPDAKVDHSLQPYTKEEEKDAAIYAGAMAKADQILDLSFRSDKTEFLRSYDRLPSRSKSILESRKPNYVRWAGVSHRAQEKYETAGGGDAGITALLRHYIESKAFRHLVKLMGKGKLGAFQSDPASFVALEDGWYLLDQSERETLRNMDGPLQEVFGRRPDRKPPSVPSLSDSESSFSSYAATPIETSPTVSPPPEVSGKVVIPEGGESWQQEVLYFRSSWQMQEFRDLISSANRETLASLGSGQETSFISADGMILLDPSVAYPAMGRYMSYLTGYREGQLVNGDPVLISGCEMDDLEWEYFLETAVKCGLEGFTFQFSPSVQ